MNRSVVKTDKKKALDKEKEKKNTFFKVQTFYFQFFHG